MHQTKLRTALIAALTLSAQPALAAEDYRPPELNQQRQLSAYAGGTVRLALGRHGQAAPKAGLTAGFMQKNFNPVTTAPASVRVVEMVSFGGSAASRPRLSIAGVPIGRLENRLGLSTLGAVAIGGVLALGAVVAVASSSATVPDDLLTGM